jgi:hypothetical protein
MPEGIKINAYMYNAEGQKIGGSDFANDGGFDVNLTEGQTYELRVSYYRLLGNYTFIINKSATD